MTYPIGSTFTISLSHSDWDGTFKIIPIVQWSYDDNPTTDLTNTVWKFNDEIDLSEEGDTTLQ